MFGITHLYYLEHASLDKWIKVRPCPKCCFGMDVFTWKCFLMPEQKAERGPQPRVQKGPILLKALLSPPGNSRTQSSETVEMGWFPSFLAHKCGENKQTTGHTSARGWVLCSNSPVFIMYDTHSWPTPTPATDF